MCSGKVQIQTDYTEKWMNVVLMEAAKKALEVVSNPVRGLQAYNIRKMDQYMPTGKDIDNYKLSVDEQPLDNQQKYLDVLCFPTLFPTGMYREFHLRDVKFPSVST